MSDRRRAGKAMGAVLLVLLIAGGAGAYNYHRNLQIEKQSEGPRPYKTYQEEDLQALRSAYKTELEGVRAELAHSKRQRSRVGREGSMQQNVDQFAATTRTSAAIRQAAGNVSDRQSQIAELDRELELRERFGAGVERHIKLLTSI